MDMKYPNYVKNCTDIARIWGTTRPPIIAYLQKLPIDYRALEKQIDGMPVASIVLYVIELLIQHRDILQQLDDYYAI